MRVCVPMRWSDLIANLRPEQETESLEAAET